MVSQVGEVGSLPLFHASLLVLAADSFSQDPRAQVHTPAFSFSDILSVRRVKNCENIPYCRTDKNSSLISTCCFAHLRNLSVYKKKVLPWLHNIEIKFQGVDKHLSTLPRASLDQALLSC